jgi:hypothetical protein
MNSHEAAGICGKLDVHKLKWEHRMDWPKRAIWTHHQELTKKFAAVKVKLENWPCPLLKYCIFEAFSFVHTVYCRSLNTPRMEVHLARILYHILAAGRRVFVLYIFSVDSR